MKKPLPYAVALLVCAFVFAIQTRGARDASTGPQDPKDFEQLKADVAALKETLQRQLVESPPNVPVGTIVAYAGPVDDPKSLPRGWRPCNGAEVSRKEFEQLFAKIGTNWGKGNGSSTFNLPDLRGRFLRGVDSGAGLDPGRALGTPQQDSFKEHKHPASGVTTGRPLSVRSRAASEWKDGFAPGSLFADGTSSGISRGAIEVTVQMELSGGSETRPVNSAVIWIIRVK